MFSLLEYKGTIQLTCSSFRLRILSVSASFGVFFLFSLSSGIMQGKEALQRKVLNKLTLSLVCSVILIVWYALQCNPVSGNNLPICEKV